jgi:hypothetical protein
VAISYFGPTKWLFDDCVTLALQNGSLMIVLLLPDKCEFKVSWLFLTLARQNGSLMIVLLWPDKMAL